MLLRDDISYSDNQSLLFGYGQLLHVLSFLRFCRTRVGPRIPSIFITAETLVSNSEQAITLLQKWNRKLCTLKLNTLPNAMQTSSNNNRSLEQCCVTCGTTTKAGRNA